MLSLDGGHKEEIRFYDTVEVKSEKGISFWIFQNYQSYPAYKIVFTREK